MRPQEAVDFWHEWMSHELPFLEHQRPWERAALVLAGDGSPTSGARTSSSGPRPLVMRYPHRATYREPTVLRRTGNTAVGEVHLRGEVGA